MAKTLITKAQVKRVQAVKDSVRELSEDLQYILETGFKDCKIESGGLTNKEWLENSIVHFMLAVDGLINSKDISEEDIMDKYEEAKEKK
jgi:hypothetical protein